MNGSSEMMGWYVSLLTKLERGYSVKIVHVAVL